MNFLHWPKTHTTLSQSRAKTMLCWGFQALPCKDWQQFSPSWAPAFWLTRIMLKLCCRGTSIDYTEETCFTVGTLMLLCDFWALLDFNDFIIFLFSNNLSLMITKPEKHADFQKCILFFGVFKNTSPTTISHLVLFNFIQTLEFDEHRKHVLVGILNPGHSGKSVGLLSVSWNSVASWILLIHYRTRLVTALKGDDRSVSCWLRSDLREGDFQPAVNTAAARIQVKFNCTWLGALL